MVDIDFLNTSPPVMDAESLRASIVLMQQELAVLDAADVVAFDAVDLAAMAFACQERHNTLTDQVEAMRRNPTLSGRQARIAEAQRIADRNRVLSERLTALANGRRPVVVVVVGK